MTEIILTAFYDLDLAPVSYDFSCFFILAEMERQRQSCTRMHVVIVPGADTTFRGMDTDYDDANKTWRLHNILASHISIAPGNPSFSICGTRSDAERIINSVSGPIFPVAYCIENPTAEFMWSQIAAASARGETIPSYRASHQARTSMAKWLASCTDGRLPVSITLRESSHAVPRNSNIKAWHDFAVGLDKDRYHPIIVRDTEKIFTTEPDEFSSFTTCSLASLNLDLRIALYEHCWLNLMIPGGPGVPCWLDANIRFLNFKIINEDWPNTTTAYVTSQGIKIGGQLPHATPYQRLVWEPDDLNIIENEFTEMAARINEGESCNSRAESPGPDPNNSEAPINVALRLQMSGRPEEAASIYQEIVGEDPDNADAWHLLGLIAHQADRPDAAEKMILRAIALTGGQANYFVNLAMVLRTTGRTEEATNCLWRAIALRPSDAGAHGDLSELLFELGDTEKAKAAMLQALKLKPDSIDLCERGGRLFHTACDFDIAANLYRKALNLRAAAGRQRLAAQEKMPELPVTTLKTS